MQTRRSRKTKAPNFPTVYNPVVAARNRVTIRNPPNIRIPKFITPQSPCISATSHSPPVWLHDILMSDIDASVERMGLHPIILQIPHNDSHTSPLRRLRDQVHLFPQRILVAPRARIRRAPSGADGAFRYRPSARVSGGCGIGRDQGGLIRGCRAGGE
jgi:hypothetical protein